MNTRAVSTFPGPDGLVHWEGLSRGIPQEIASGILDFARVSQPFGRSKVKKVLERFDYSLSSNEITIQIRKNQFSLSLNELTAIFEAEFGMISEEATSTAASFFRQLNSAMLARH